MTDLTRQPTALDRLFAPSDLQAPGAGQTLFEEVVDRRSWGAVSHAFGRLAASGPPGPLQNAVGHVNRWLTKTEWLTERQEWGAVIGGFAVVRRISEYGVSEELITGIIRACIRAN